MPTATKIAPFAPGLILLVYGPLWFVGVFPLQPAVAILFGLLALLVGLAAGCDFARLGRRLLSWRALPRIAWHLLVCFEALWIIYLLFVLFTLGFDPIDGYRNPEP